ncbi:GNAT family N-acetyltransferase [Streptomyces sp. NPDC046977]|uniref:GNAT family N-acetyltransferase n=1 Tax=Streptomyces sp. NPDC046977 TaxID=3154703 RepID=UPI00340BD16A
MTRIRVDVAHTADLDRADLDAARALLVAAFDGGFDDTDWEHSLGGLHTLVREGAELIGHAALVQRRVLHDGRALRTGYVEGVGVRADRRGRGHGAALMDALERRVRRAYDLGALAAADGAGGFYAARGWRPWRGPTSVLTPSGVLRTPDDDDCVYVLPTAAPLDLAGDLVCDWRDGDAW